MRIANVPPPMRGVGQEGVRGRGVREDGVMREKGGIIGHKV